MFAISLYLVRSQQTVDDVAYMEAMIPHHSIAIMTAAAPTSAILGYAAWPTAMLTAQVREIGQMKALIADLKAHPAPRNAPVLPPAPAR